MEFWRFSQPVNAGPELTGSYAPALVVLSVAIACVAAFVGLGATRRMLEVRSSRRVRLWWVLGAASLGAGVWAMHFTGMLAFRLPLTISYSWPPTFLSVLPAAAGSAVALRVLAGRTRTPLAMLSGALCLALGIGAMHYIGMEAMRMDGMMHYEPPLFLGSVVLAWGFAIAGMYANTATLTAPAAGFLQRFGAPALLGLSVSAMHYTAMVAASFHSGGGSRMPHHTVPTGMLGIAIAVFSLFLLLVILLFTWLDMRLTSARDMVRDRVARLRAVLDTMPDGLITVDAAGNVEAMNVAAAKLFGVQETGSAGRPITDFLSTVARSPVSARDGRPTTSRAVGLYVDGTTFPVDVKSAMTNIGSREITTLVVRDMTDRRAAEERLNRLAAAVEQASEAIVITDATGHVTYVNPAFSNMTGYSIDDVRGQVPDVLRPDHSTPDFHDQLWKTLRAGRVWKGAYVNQRRDGSTYETEASITPLRDDTAAVTSFIEVRRDVSEQQEMARQLARAQKLEGIGQLASGIAHEINTPTQYVGDNLRFIKDSIGEIGALLDALRPVVEGARTGSARDHVLDDLADVARATDLAYLMKEMPAALDQALDGVERITAIVSAMKAFSHPSIDKVPSNLNEMVRSTVMVAKHEWKYVAEVDFDLDPALPPVFCVPADVNQAVLNLVVNAAHAIEQSVQERNGPKGRITLSTRVDEHCAVLAISDTGTGIPENIRNRIFDPFFTTKEVGKGTGQGLTLVHEVIVRTHGGSISVDSTPGVGTVFTLRLPLAVEEPDAFTTDDPEAPGDTVAVAATRG